MTRTDETYNRAVHIIEFRYGDPVKFVRFTDHSADVSVGPLVFTSLMSTEINLAPITGTLKESDTRLVMPRFADAFLERISNAEPHAPISITIADVLASPVNPLDRDVHTVFVGRVRRVIRHFQGKRDRVGIEVANWKSQLEEALGIQANSYCVWPFGFGPCGTVINLPAITETGTVTAIDGVEVTIVRDGGDPARRDRYFHKGSLKRDGLEISIKDWLNGTVYVARKPPPADWLGEEVDVVPGCSKDVATCRLWDAESVMMAAGESMQAYHPVIEDRASGDGA